MFLTFCLKFLQEILYTKFYLSYISRMCHYQESAPAQRTVNRQLQYNPDLCAIQFVCVLWRPQNGIYNNRFVVIVTR